MQMQNGTRTKTAYKCSTIGTVTLGNCFVPSLLESHIRTVPTAFSVSNVVVLLFSERCDHIQMLEIYLEKVATD